MEADGADAGGVVPGRGVGPVGLIAQSVARAAPAAAFVLIVVTAATFSGGALPLALLVGLGWALLVAVPIGEMARFHPSAGGFAASAAHELHPVAGFAVGWAYLLAEMLAVALFVVVFAQSGSEYLAREAALPRFPGVLGMTGVAAAFLAVLAGAGLGARVRWAGVLAAIGLGTFAALAVWLIAVAGDANTVRPFGPGAADMPGFRGLSGVLAGSAVVAVAFLGVTGSVPLAEDAGERRRGVGQAVPAAAVVVGVWAVVVAYALVVSYGTRPFAGFPQAGSGHPVEFVAGGVWGRWRVLITVGILTSSLGGAVAAMTAAGRTASWLGRVGILPALGDEGSVTPWRPIPAIAVPGTVGVVSALWLEIQFGPSASVAILSVLVGAILLGVVAVASVSCVVHHARRGRWGVRPIVHVMAAAVGLVGVVVAWSVSTGLGSGSLEFARPLPYPVNLAGPVFGAWCVLGAFRLLQLLRRGDRPLDRLRATANRA